MAIVPIQDGKVVDTNKTNALEAALEKGKTNGLDKDAFLGLLVAQMKYQDPLEPTSNTEFVSQYATFSELEQMQNMSTTLELSRASTLVGEIVTVNTTDVNGKSVNLQGKVDYVVYENGKSYISIGGAEYSLDDVYGVADQEYLDAYDKAYDFTVKLNKLPKLENISLDYAEDVDELSKIYKDMTDYEKTFLAKSSVNKFEEYADRIAELRKDKEENDKETGKDETKPEDEKKTEGDGK